MTNNVKDAIRREKQIKGWLRSKKFALIKSLNPDWKDLSKDWYGDSSPFGLRMTQRSNQNGAEGYEGQICPEPMRRIIAY